MPVTIPDELLQEAGLSEREARIEIACKLFDLGKLSLPAATKWTGMGRAELEDELDRRGISIYRPTLADLHDDLAAIQSLGS